ncbi:beta-propeller fold lactonase family protein [Qipengyuania sp. DY56-A-20]|uniref:Beta-propeller fold lactonase family protein n=1 Tax=Qipengyuania benthica TaxID=3067651 RepID=A0ABT9H8G8_9SPHN|nr:beta-propeller fold lactonase family protein [Qipengyuania sp. DY56-A-20]MDP4539607.1 beta-propeller fold lactonase family protein [Qipengyuania sp. DY56-A-20]
MRIIPTLALAWAPAALGLAACAPIAADAPTVADAAAQGGTLFVANKFGNTLTKIDLATGETVLEVPSCTNPHELATSPDGAHVALACYGGTSVDIFRTSDLARLKSVELGANARPHGIVWHANGALYATAEGRKSVFWIRDPLGKAETFEYGTGQEGSHMLAISPDARHAWTVDMGSGTVTLVDLLTRRAPLSVAVGVEPEGIALAPDGETLWVSARGSDKAFALDPMNLEIRSELATGAFPLRLAIRPQGDVAVTSDLADGGLTVIDLARAEAIRSIPVAGPEGAQERMQVTVIWSQDGERIYVAETGDDTIAEVDYASGRVRRRLEAGDGGDGLAVLP